MEDTKPVDQKVKRMTALLVDIAAMVIQDPTCLDGNPLKAQVYKFQLTYLENKRKLSNSDVNSQRENARGNVPFLERLVDKYWSNTNQEEKENIAKKVTVYIYNATVEELSQIPVRLKDSAFVIALVCMARIFNP